MLVRSYFFLGSFTGDSGIVPVLRSAPNTEVVVTAATEAMNALIAGPNARELAAHPAMYTVVPPRTTVLGLTITDGVATVDLSPEFDPGDGGPSATQRFAQVVLTLTQFPTIRAVQFELSGSPMTALNGAGIALDRPATRSDSAEQRASIWVDRPAWGAAIGNPARVAGLTDVFEATFRVAILDGSSTVLADTQVMASCGTGCWGTFDVNVPYVVATAQWGTLRVYDLSAKDGTREHVVDYPVWLTPAP
jgi:hypothetical protein